MFFELLMIIGFLVVLCFSVLIIKYKCIHFSTLMYQYRLVCVQYRQCMHMLLLFCHDKEPIYHVQGEDF